MREKTIINKIKKMAMTHGWAEVAVMLGERDTQSIKRWIKQGFIPEYKTNLITQYLKRSEKHDDVK